ncbi:class I SAM-dependent methyltransferase, partial [Streptomyces sp. NPDC048362]|uniref:class I SAM-dependent methyltransferase n=1 Tax=Streptomyces sp. NPDC048362 TaxID=3365539 RepID=UPI0037142B60
MTQVEPRPATRNRTRTRGHRTAPVDAERWRDVAAVPRASWPVRAVTASVLEHTLRRLPLRVRFADGSTLGLGGPLMEVRDPKAFHARIGTSGLIGFGESYMAGEWDAPDLVGALTVLAAHAADLIPGPLQRLRGVWAQRQPDAQRNTPDGSRTNISRHYDLSNDLFALFLDETLTYSSAVFRGFPADWSLLAAAQQRKIDRLLDLAGVEEGTRLLEIGTGWEFHPSLERVLGPRLDHPAVTWLLERYGSPAALRKAGRRRLVELIRPKAPRMAHRLIDEVFDALDEQTVIVPGTGTLDIVIPSLAASL